MRLNEKDCQNTIDLFLFQKMKTSLLINKQFFQIGEIANTFKHEYENSHLQKMSLSFRQTPSFRKTFEIFQS